jgi:ribonuclease Z
MDKATVLGTASAFPTKLRNHPSIYLNLGGAKVLFDCGEGTQRQIRSAGLSPSVDFIFVTHWHGDHSLGVGGIIQSLNMMKNEGPLTVMGPSGTNASVKHILDTYKFYKRLPIKIRSIDAKKELLVKEINGHNIYAINVKHAVKCLGYKVKENDVRNIRKDLLEKLGVKPGPQLKFLKAGKDIVVGGKKLKASQFTYIKKGRSLVYLTDLVYEKNIYKFAKDADVLIIESTFSSNMQNQAKEFMHLTVKDALTIAKQSCAGRVYLTHLSQRYENSGEIRKEAADLAKSMGLKAEVAVPDDLSEIII